MVDEEDSKSFGSDTVWVRVPPSAPEKTVNLNDWRFFQRKKAISYGMRVSPVGWRFNTLEETLRFAKISADVTHNHPEGEKGAMCIAAAIFLARQGKTKEEIRSCLYHEFGYEMLLSDISSLRKKHSGVKSVRIQCRRRLSLFWKVRTMLPVFVLQFRMEVIQIRLQIWQAPLQRHFTVGFRRTFLPSAVLVFLKKLFPFAMRFVKLI